MSGSIYLGSHNNYSNAQIGNNTTTTVIGPTLKTGRIAFAVTRVALAAISAVAFAAGIWALGGVCAFVATYLIVAAVIPVPYQRVSGSFTSLTLKGSGELTTKTNDLESYQSISLGGVGKLILTPDLPAHQVEVETDDNIQDHVVAEVSNGCLKLGLRTTNTSSSINPTKLTYRIGVNENLKSLKVSGAAKVESFDLIGTADFDLSASGASCITIRDLDIMNVLSIKCSGASRVTLKGKAKACNVKLSGASSLNLSELVCCAEDIRVNQSGASSLTRV